MKVVWFFILLKLLIIYTLPLGCPHSTSASRTILKRAAGSFRTLLNSTAVLIDVVGSSHLSWSCLCADLWLSYQWLHILLRRFPNAMIYSSCICVVYLTLVYMYISFLFECARSNPFVNFLCVSVTFSLWTLRLGSPFGETSWDWIVHYLFSFYDNEEPQQYKFKL